MLKPYIIVSSNNQIHTSIKACYTWVRGIHIPESTPPYRGLSALLCFPETTLGYEACAPPTYWVVKPCSSQVQDKQVPHLMLAQPASTILHSKPGNFPQPVIQILWFVKPYYRKLCKDLSCVHSKQPVKLNAVKSQGKKHHIRYIMADAKPSILSQKSWVILESNSELQSMISSG